MLERELKNLGDGKLKEKLCDRLQRIRTTDERDLFF